MTKTFRDNCDIDIVQQTSCEPLFPVVQMQLKTYFSVPFVRPCMHLNYGVISGSHACRDCGWHIILVGELYTTCPGERVLVTTKLNVTFLPLRLCYVNTSSCLSKDAENLTTYGYVLWCSQIFVPYSSLFFEHYNRILLCDWVIELCSVRLIDGVSSHNAFAFSLDSTNLGISAILRSSAVTSVLANNSVKNVYVTLWFCLQCSCKKCL